MKFLTIFNRSFGFKVGKLYFPCSGFPEDSLDDQESLPAGFWAYYLRETMLMASMSTTHLVFLYGTLKRGEPNHHWLQSKENGHARFISKGKTIKKYPLIITTKYNIPFLLQSPGRGENVIGEVYEVDDKMLSHLDILEDHPTLYVREFDQIQIMGTEEKTAESTLSDCWIYFLKNFKPSLLEEECYAEYQSEGGHLRPYMPREKRIPGYHAKMDVLQT